MIGDEIDLLGKVDAAYARIENGEDFVAVVKDASDDETTRDNGGVIEGAMEAVVCDWFELAGEQRRKKFGAEAPADFKEKARQMRFLQYRGFEQDHIQAAVGPDGE